MAVTITNESSTIKFVWTNGEEVHIDKSGLSIKKGLFFVHISGNEDFVNTDKVIKLRYTEVTSPVVASNDELVAAILGYKASSGVTIGDVRITDGVEIALVDATGALKTSATFGANPGVEFGNVGIVDAAGERLDLKTNTHTSKGEILVNMEGHVCENNSSDANLGAGATFTGDWEDTIDYGSIVVGVKADTNSASDGLKIQWSADGTNVHDQDQFTILANNGKVFTFQPARRYFRVTYTNGTSAQSSFNLETTLRRYYIKPSSHRIQDNIVAEDDAELVKAVITGQNPSGIFQNVQVSDNGNFKVNLAEFGDTPSIDAFGRLRTSEPYTLFDSKQLHDKQPLFWDEDIGNSAGSTHVPVDAATVMDITAAAADYVIRQTKQRFNYQPGKSQLAFLTFFATKTGYSTKRIGLFDGTGVNYMTPNNGVWLEIDGTISFNIAKNGTTTETVAQANWNVDTLDGNGVSGKTLDWDAPQILVIDYEWLGVGRVRVGFVIDGLVYYVHYFNHANDPSFDSVYMSSPNLPIRYDIQANGLGVDELHHICSTVMSEGGLEETGVMRGISTTTHVDASSSGTAYAIAGIKLKSAYKDVTVMPEYVSAIDLQGGAFKWELCLNPTVAGTFTYNDITNSALQAAYGATANTVSAKGTVINSGFVPAGGVNSGSGGDTKITTALRMGSTIDGVMDSIVLVVTPLASNEDIHESITVRELL